MQRVFEAIELDFQPLNAYNFANIKISKHIINDDLFLTIFLSKSTDDEEEDMWGSDFDGSGKFALFFSR